MNQFVEYATELDLEENSQNISEWIDHDLKGASTELGEQLVGAIGEMLSYE